MERISTEKFGGLSLRKAKCSHLRNVESCFVQGIDDHASLVEDVWFNDEAASFLSRLQCLSCKLIGVIKNFKAARINNDFRSDKQVIDRNFTWLTSSEERAMIFNIILEDEELEFQKRRREGKDPQ
jgi:hypothetical protein